MCISIRNKGFDVRDIRHHENIILKSIDIVSNSLIGAIIADIWDKNAYKLTRISIHHRHTELHV